MYKVIIMKKMLIIFLNFMLFCSILICFDYLLARKDYHYHIKSVHGMMEQHKDNKNMNFELPAFNYTLRLRPFSEFYKELEQGDHFNSLRRQIAFLNGDEEPKSSIILFGCSFVEGSFLEYNETFGYKLSKKLHRTVYNRGFSGFGIPQMLWQARYNNFYKKIDTEPQYVIYVYIFDHLRRIYESKYGHINVYLGYELKTNKNGTHLIEKNPLLLQLNRFYITRYTMQNFIFPKYLSKKNDDKNFDLIKLHFIETRKELQKKYPNIKFIIIKHPFGQKYSSPKDLYSLDYSYTTPRWKELEDEGFIVYDLKDRMNVDITDDEYTFPDGHPNSKAWDIIIDKMTKDLNIK